MRHCVALRAGNAADPAGDLTAKSEKALSGSGRAFFITASDIVEVRKLKANLVSVNVDRLVQEGYLRREAVAGDRRKTLNRATGIVLVVLGIVVMGFNLLTK